MKGDLPVRKEREFSIVMPFRDTPRERKFAEKSIPSAIALKPSEIVVGVDAPVKKSLISLIRHLCKRESFDRLRIIEVLRSDQWNFQLANTIWHCYKACQYDRILAFDVDTVLLPAVLRGYNLVGSGENAVVSFTKRLLIRTPSDLIRHLSYRLRVRTSAWTFAGTYWLYRPHYFEDIDLAGMQSITNGIDTYMTERIMKIGKHRVVTLKDIGSISMDQQNEDYPWRQFQDGVWYGANRKTFRANRWSQASSEDKSVVRRVIGKILDWDPRLFIVIKATAYQHPWLVRGWLWAGRHPDHEAVIAARNSTYLEWSLSGSKFINNLYDWKKTGRTGTGFA